MRAGRSGWPGSLRALDFLALEAVQNWPPSYRRQRVGRRTIDDMLRDARARLDRLTPEAAYRAAQEGWILVDVRAGDLRARDGVIPGALHAALNVLEWRVDPASGYQHRELVGHDGRLILICAEGYSSSLAAVRLQELGFPLATDVIGGFEAWRDAGLPVEVPRCEAPDGRDPKVQK